MIYDSFTFFSTYCFLFDYIFDIFALLHLYSIELK